jgi:deazaflavin-dependent oxidoreductase (nitroreductase family)
MGWLLGQRFARLTHIGRRSGRRYQTVLEVVGTNGDGEVYVMAGFGHSADWYQNVQAHPPLEIAMGRRRFTPICRTLTEVEAASVLQAYERRNRILAFVIRKVLSRLVGWRYDGSFEARMKIVDQLPIVGFQLEPVLK